MTTNTHIAAHPKQLCMMAAAILGQPPGTMDNRHPYWPEAVKQAERAYAALQSAQALEAVPALDAQGEALVRFCPSCGRVGEVGAQYRDCCPDGSNARMIPEKLAGQCRDLFLAVIDAAPLPHAVGKPLSEQQADAIQRDSEVRKRLVNYARTPEDQTAIELIKAVAHGIVTKESDT